MGEQRRPRAAARGYHCSWPLNARGRTLLVAIICGIAGPLLLLAGYYQTGVRLCEAPVQEWAAQTYKLPLVGILGQITLPWLRDRFGDLTVWVAASSRVLDDMTDMDDGGLPERHMSLRTFINEIEGGRTDLQHNYLKLADPLRHAKYATGPIDDVKDVLPFGDAVARAMRASLHAAGVVVPRNLSFSLWLGARGSTTAMHVDDQPFNALLVLRGAKRVVILDDGAATLPCHRPPQNPRACWTGIDVLAGDASSTLSLEGATAPTLREVTLRAGDALLLPEMTWHAVENLEPTLAVGVNEISEEVCVGRRFAALREPGWFRSRFVGRRRAR